MDFSEFTDDDLLDRLEDAALAHRLESLVEWKIIQEACQRLVDFAQKQLQEVNPEEYTKIIEYQLTARLFGKGFLPALIQNMQRMGELSFNEAKEREIIERG